MFLSFFFIDWSLILHIEILKPSFQICDKGYPIKVSIFVKNKYIVMEPLFIFNRHLKQKVYLRIQKITVLIAN